jgi:hypothetical protein
MARAGRDKLLNLHLDKIPQKIPLDYLQRKTIQTTHQTHEGELL